MNPDKGKFHGKKEHKEKITQENQKKRVKTKVYINAFGDKSYSGAGDNFQLMDSVVHLYYARY